MKRIIMTLTRLVRGASRKNMSVCAAGIAFFWILSLVPILIVVSCILPYTSITEEILIGYMAEVLPMTVRDFAVSLIIYVYSSSSGILPAAVIVAIWSAGKGMMSMIQGLNSVYEIKEKRGYFRLRIVASMYTLAMLVGIIFVLVVLVFGRTIYDTFLIKITFLYDFIYTVLHFRFLISVLFLTVLYTLTYTYVPNIKIRIKEQLGCGFLAALASTVFAYGFSIYVDYFNDFSNYGSLSIVIIIMLWLYFTMYIMLYCAYIGKFLRGDEPYQSKESWIEKKALEQGEKILHRN